MTITQQQEKVKKEQKGFVIKVKKFGNKALEVTKKTAQNRYLGSIMEGFMLVMPVIIVSSLFMLMAEIAPAFGYKWKDEATGEILNGSYFQYYRFCMWAYNLSYGIIGMLLAVAISAKLMDKLNTDLPAAKKVNVVAVGVTSVIGYLCISVGQAIWGGDTSTGFTSIAIAAFGIKGMLPAIIVSFVVPNIYKFCFRYNVTIRLPKQVPQAISQSFLSIFPLFFSLIIFATFGFVFAFLTGESFLNSFFNWLAPVFGTASTWQFSMGYTAIFSFVWFIGIHPSVLSAVHETIKAQALAINQKIVQEGGHPTNIWADSLWTAITQPGGTGATLAVPLVIILFAKSKQLKTIGYAALVPVLFQVNEPVLFGVPMVLNPLMFLPFILTPVLTCGLGALFVNAFGMPASNVALPWCMIQFISIPISSGLDWRAFLLPFVIYAFSFAAWTPFILLQDKIYQKSEIRDEAIFYDNRNLIEKGYDRIFAKQKADEIKLKVNEAKKEAEKLANLQVTQPIKVQLKDSGKQKNVLVICLGAGSSAMLANAINDGAKQSGQEKILLASATSIGDYSHLITGMDLIILSPQAKSRIVDISKACDPLGIPIYQTSGAEYLELTRDHQKAFQVVVKQLDFQEAENDEKVYQ